MRSTADLSDFSRGWQSKERLEDTHEACGCTVMRSRKVLSCYARCSSCLQALSLAFVALALRVL